MEPDWDDLRIFLAVARTESLSGAGRGLRLDPATVGRRVARLEERLGAALFAKSPQGYALTGQGQGLLPHAERAEQAVTAAREEVRGEAGGLSGQVRIGAPDGCATYVLPQVCADIAAANPALEIQIVALPRVFNLSKREADMAIAVSRPATGRLTVQKITDYRLHLAAHEGYLAAAPALETLADLRAHRIVGYIPDMIFDRELDYLAETGAEAATLASNSVPVQFNLLRQQAGVGIVHDFALPSDPAVRRVLSGLFSLTRAFHLIRHADDRRVERLNRFALALADGVRREVARLESIA
jgi:DNA-binding transcriptional LysR family regulator